MEDNDWSDIPCNSQIKSEIIDILSDHSDNTIPEEKEDKIHNKDVTKLLTIKTCEKEMKKSSNKECCPICLSSYTDRSFLDQCFHSFCFCCILQWCEVVQTCPLCKSPFASLIHNVKSMDNYEQHVVEKKNDQKKKENNAVVTYNEHGFNEHGNRFRYRTTRHATQEIAPQNRQRWGTRRRRHSRNTRQSERNEGMEKRRQVYSYKLKAMRSSQNGGTKKCRNISAIFYKDNPACTHRLIPWVLRDLTVLLGNNEEEVNFLMEFILKLISRFNMESIEFLNELRPFLLETTDHFVHELLLFAKSPFDMIAYDECVIYPWPNEHQERSQTSEETTDCHLNIRLIEESMPRCHDASNEILSCDNSGLFSQVERNEDIIAENNTRETLTTNKSIFIEDVSRVGQHYTQELIGTTFKHIISVVTPSTLNDRWIPSSNNFPGGDQEVTGECSTSNNNTPKDVPRTSGWTPSSNSSTAEVHGECSIFNTTIHNDLPLNSCIPNSCQLIRDSELINTPEDSKERTDISHHSKRHKRHKRRHKRKLKHKTEVDCSSNNEIVSIKEMLEEIHELNIQIRQHEQQLLVLDTMKKSL